MKSPASTYNELFYQFQDSLFRMDPVYFCAKYLKVDGKPLDLIGTGYKPFQDIYRYIGISAIEKNSKPIVMVKGRQVGATTMAAALECYFIGCGRFGTHGRSPMRMMHLFPTLSLAAAYTKDKLDPMIGQAAPVPGTLKKNGLPKSFMENIFDSSSPANDSMHFKKFMYGNQIWIESTGLDGDRVRGRMLNLETELPTPTGFIKLKDLREGDELFDDKGNVCKCIKLHPIHKSPESYKVTFDDGTTIDACADHLWMTYTKKDRNIEGRNNYKLKRRAIRREQGKEYKPFLERNSTLQPTIKTTKEILETLKHGKEYNHSIPVIPYADYSEKELPIDPYILGIWLGDGASIGGLITSADPEIFEGYEHNLVPSSLNVYNEKAFSKDGYSKSNNYRIPGLTTKLRKLGLIQNKHIPDIYLCSSYEQRLALLQGLMDTDGCCYKDGRCEFVQIVDRENLVFQVKELISSLGIKCRINRKVSLRYNKRYKDKYQLIFTTTKPVFRLNRKLEKQIKNITTKQSHRFIRSIDPIEPVSMRCITVDNPSHLYLVTRSYIATHNTVDCAFYDEVQDMTDLSIGAVAKILTKSNYGTTGQGLQVYFGTPKTKGGSYWEMWKNSSQQYFHLRCEKCGSYFPLYRPDTNWEDVWIYGMTVRCTDCAHEQDKNEAVERGKWIPLNNPDECDFVGYHFNQLYIPTFTRETVIKARPDRSPINTERVYMNEVLGEFYDGEGGTITTEQIRTKCIDKDRRMVKYIHSDSGKRVYAGFDWGQRGALEQLTGRGGKKGSYSCAVILTAQDNIFNIEFATRLMKADPETKEGAVEEMFRRYNMTLAVGDIGDAYDLTHRMQRTYDERFLASRAQHRVIGHVKYSADEWPKTIVFEKDYYIGELLGLLKEGRIKFPGGHHHKVEWLIEHCASMDIKVTKDKSGEPLKKYVKGSGANDGLMALLNAYLAWKFDVTQGFSIANPLHMKYEIATEARPVQAVIGYIPRMNGRR